MPRSDISPHCPGHPPDKVRGQPGLHKFGNQRERAFAAAWTEGRSMSPEQALAARGPMTVSMPIPASLPSPPPTKISSYPASLTAREVEVLRLLAQGMTNEQIAKQLVISPRTVNTHLTSIFGKIGVSTRSAATRYAIDHHLI